MDIVELTKTLYEKALTNYYKEKNNDKKDVRINVDIVLDSKLSSSVFAIIAYKQGKEVAHSTGFMQKLNGNICYFSTGKNGISLIASEILEQGGYLMVIPPNYGNGGHKNTYRIDSKGVVSKYDLGKK